MNIVDLLKSQLSGDVIGKLSGLIGEDEDTTRSAVGAAAPVLLSALSGLATSGAGAQKLATALGGLDTEGTGNVAGMLSGQAGPEQEQGGKLLGSLFGGSTDGIIGALAKFTGLGQGSLQKLLGLLLPMILGVIGKQMKGKGLSAQSLLGFFADQKQNIAGALPSGLSLKGIPGVDAAGTAVQAAKGAVQDAGSSVVKWLLPLAGIVLLGLLVWRFWGGSAPDELPSVSIPSTQKITVTANKIGADAAEMGKAVTGVTASLTETLAEIKDEATAETALPKLKDASEKLDEIGALWDKLPDAGKKTIAALVAPQLTKLKKLIDPVVQLPGVGDLVKPVLDGIVEKLTALGE